MSLGDAPITRRNVLIGGVLGAGAVLLTSCTGTKGTTGQSSRTLRYADSDTPPGFDDDTNGATDFGEKIVENCYGGSIVQLKLIAGPNNVQVADVSAPGNTGIANGLATKVTVSDNLRRYVFKLDPKAGSPAGSKLSADDVVWEFHRSLALKQTGQFMANAMGVTDPSQVRALDSQTVEFVLQYPSPAFLKIDAVKIYPGLVDSKTALKHATKKDPWARDWLGKNTAGYGAYTVAGYQKGQYVNLKANPNWQQGAPAFGRVVWQAVPESSARLALLERGGADIVNKLTPPQLRQVEQNPKLTVTHYVSNQFKSIQLNLRYAPLADRRVRQAIALALPYDQILSSVYLGTAELVKSPLPAIYPGYTGEFWNYKTNLDKARSLMKDSQMKPFKMTLTFNQAEYDDPLLAPIIRAALKNIGIDVTLQGLPSSTFFESLYSGKGHAHLQVNWPLVADAGYCLGVYWRSDSFLNVGAWKNTKYDSVVDQLRKTADPKEVEDLAKEGQRIWMEDLPWIMLANPGYHVAHSKAVSSPAWYPGNGIRFYEMKPVKA